MHIISGNWVSQQKSRLVLVTPIVGYLPSHHFSFLATESFLYDLYVGMKHDIRNLGSYLVITKEATLRRPSAEKVPGFKEQKCIAPSKTGIYDINIAWHVAKTYAFFS